MNYRFYRGENDMAFEKDVCDKCNVEVETGHLTEGGILLCDKCFEEVQNDKEK